MTDERALAAQEVRLYLPSRAVTDLKGRFANKRDVQKDALGNKQENVILARGAIQQMAEVLTDSQQFRIKPDGEIVPKE